jgi:hypothetical protein
MSDTMQGLSTAARARAVAAAEHNGVLEGLHLDAASQADAGEYVAGEITSADLVARARARFGLDAPAGLDR